MKARMHPRMNPRLVTVFLALAASSALAQNVPPSPGGTLQPGLYVQVLDGMINVSNQGGSSSFAAGQFGYTPNVQQPPVVLPVNPGMQFTPPPVFNAPSSSSTASAKSNTVDCVVR